MARMSLPVCISLTLLIFFSCPIIRADPPTYSDCKPLIDATIYDLAAKAVHAGEHAEEPRTEHPCPAASVAAPEVAVPEVEEPQIVVPPPAEELPPQPVPVVHPPAEELPIQQVPETPKEPVYVPPAPIPTPKQPEPTATKRKLGIFESFINSVFGLSGQYEQDPKWAVPWNTHPEFKKEKVEKAAIKVDDSPGFIRKSIVNLIYAVFGNKPASDAVRDPKWAQPWQTHPEHKREKVEKAPVEAKKVDDSPGVIRESITNFIYLIFGHKPKTGEKDPKWAQPWQTHPEHKREKVEKAPVEAKKVDDSPGVIRESITNFIYLIFGHKPTTGEKDPKWAQPWQTHPEHKREKVDKAQIEIKKVDDSPGVIRQTITNFIYTVFGNKPTSDVKDPKWAQPWQTHPEHMKKPKEGAHVPPHTPAAHVPPPPPPPPARAPPPPPAVHAPPPPPPVAQVPPPPPVAKVPPPPPVAQAPPPAPAAQTPPPSPAPAKPEKVQEKVVPAPLKEDAFPSATQDEPAAKKPAPAPADRVVDAPKAPVKQVLEEVAPHTEVPPREAAFEEHDQIVVVPSAFRSRDHINSILGLDEASVHSAARTGPIEDATLRDLKKVYETAVKPLETTFKYLDISNRHLSDAELFGTPLILMLGPYSTGKSTFVNYLLGVEFTKRALKTGTPPSHGVFRIIQYGEHDRDLDGTDLTGHWSFGSLQKFGQNFVDQVRGKALNIPLLKKATFVEAPGILEMRRPGERLYPFNDAVQWFIDRADLILVMFDYTKLDAGYEMEAILDQLKGREAQTRILLNKADQVPPEELMKVQGSLFWNLSPILGIAAPPSVYVGSFTSLPYRPSAPVKLFQAQEEALLYDVAKAINSRVDNRIAITRRHAVRVRNHAQMVDTYLKVFYTNKGFLTSKHKLAEEIVENPHAYNIYEGMSLLTNISRYDLPDAEVYRDFFRIHNLYDFRTLRETCSFIGGCPLDKIEAAINKQLPELMDRHRRLVEAASPQARLPNPSLRTASMGAGAPHVHSNKL